MAACNESNQFAGSAPLTLRSPHNSAATWYRRAGGELAVVFHIYTTVAFIYLLWRFVLPLPVSRGVKVGAAIALLAISKYHLLSQVFFGNMFSPELPFLVVLALGWLFCAFVLLVTFTALGDLAYVLYFLIQRAHWSRQSANWWRGMALAAAALLLRRRRG